MPDGPKVGTISLSPARRLAHAFRRVRNHLDRSIPELPYPARRVRLHSAREKAHASFTALRQWPGAIFSPMMPISRKVAASMRQTFEESPNQMMPTMKVPSAPMPVHTA